MGKIQSFDILIVYNDLVALSASKKGVKAPFAEATSNYNSAYFYFLESCKALNLKAAFTTTHDFEDSGTFSSYWIIENDDWKPVKKRCFSKFVFDKYSPTTKEKKRVRANISSNPDIQSFNSPELFGLFFDKQITYDKFSASAIPTVSIDSSKHDHVQKALDSLKAILTNHPNNSDFSGDYVVKDRFGSGGDRIFLTEDEDPRDEISAIMKGNGSTQFILQPFTNFEKGYSHKKKVGFVDIRIVFLNGKAIQSYVRMAKKDDFRCNEHQGGSLEYIQIKNIPEKIITLANTIVKHINIEKSLYSLDFIVSDNGNVYFLEGNTGPGLDWNLSLKMNELYAKKLIRTIVKTIPERIAD